MERLNLGKPFFPNERDNLLKDQGALPQSSSYPMVTSAVLTPRQRGCLKFRRLRLLEYFEEVQGSLPNLELKSLLDILSSPRSLNI